MSARLVPAPLNHSQVRCAQLIAESNTNFTFKGVWEIPLNAHYVEGYEGGHCPYLDQCVLHNHDAEEVFEWLQEDFSRYYDQNRAPYMMPFHTNWFSIKELEQGLHKFLDWLTTL